MRERWARWLDNDPAYNPNASLKNLDFSFSIATEPRVSLLQPWFEVAAVAPTQEATTARLSMKNSTS